MKRINPLFNLREYVSVLVIAVLSAAFGALLTLTGDALINAMHQMGADQLSAVKVTLSIVSWLFMGIALFVAAVVAVNTFGTVIAGRAKRLAMLRLLGASSRSLRRASVSEGLAIGAIGAVVGTVLGMLIMRGMLAVGHAFFHLPAAVHAPWVTGEMVTPAIGVVVVTVLAAWIGSRRVLAITPVQAFGSAAMASEIDSRPATASFVWSIVLVCAGCVLLGFGVLLGAFSPLGVMIAFPGGVLVTVAVLLSAERLLPPLLNIGGSGRGAAGLLAARNTQRNPRRSSRSTIGIVIGVTLITMFAVAGYTYRDVLTGALDTAHGLTAAQRTQMFNTLSAPITIALALVGFSVVLAAIGLLDSQTLSMLQREPEIGLLRALGLTRAQVRRMALFESLRMSLCASAVGLLMGIVFGWAGAFSTFGSQMMQLHHWWPTVPWQLAAAIVVGSLALTAFVCGTASRRAIRVSPVRALAGE